ncbi:protein-disulfide reductase DsbD N-terminal domain-containing protein [Olivibacter sp. SDN3]|uniref:protein-disulfide reductase DsbD N-terminal domain-containing protein n=1 Tax=Olivibacter sp. SDN3 TaxID=2764720 RepID=UPI0016514ABE|nr:protein-disulfide reductase DsbD N-terminal domain-containing protein [Olivibacter sp. SDN3]QNL50807.1 protein-disulfide reductase DsbD N-terminal domain-containing protein [Olivibacter sp. SDN3]
MKKLSVLVAYILLTLTVSAQIKTPVKWSYAAKKLNDQEAVVLIKATIEKGWHIYSQHIEPGGPVPTSFSFTSSGDYATDGETSEPKGINHFEKVFDMDVIYFENEVVFQQKLKLNKPATTVKGTVEFMVCNDKECLPPDEVSFNIPIK